MTEQTANGQQAEFFVVLADQADLSQAANLQTKAEKGRFVYNTLLNKAQTTQGPILQWLRDRAIENQSFYIVNAILVKGNRQIAHTLAARPDVARVEGNPSIHNDLPQPARIEEAPSQPAPRSSRASNTRMRPMSGRSDSPDRTSLWRRRHRCSLDAQRTQASLPRLGRSRLPITITTGTTASTIAAATPAARLACPCDDIGHGTHTMGTAIGDDGMGQPDRDGARRKMDRLPQHGPGNGTPATLHRVHAIVPRALSGRRRPQGDPTKAPDVTINSWICPPSEGCSANTLQAAVEAQAAAGIMMVVAAGNAGPGCSTVTDPPGIYCEPLLSRRSEHRHRHDCWL